MVVPTYQRPRLLQSCLEALGSQQADPGEFEVVVVDDGSGDTTGTVLATARKRMPNLRAFTLPSNRGPAAARNRGVQEASGTIVLFLDDDVVASPSLIATHLEEHARSADPHEGVLGVIRWLPGLRVTPFMSWLDRSGLQFSYDTWLQPGPVDPPYAAFYTANVSLPRRLVIDAGGFDERFPHANYEDFELAWRLSKRGLRLRYEPRAVAWHARPITLRQFCARMANEAESAQVLRQVAPDLPFDTTGRDGTPTHYLTRQYLRLAAPLAARMGREGFLDRYYRSRLAVSYRQGAARPVRMRTSDRSNPPLADRGRPSSDRVDRD